VVRRQPSYGERNSSPRLAGYARPTRRKGGEALMTWSHDRIYRRGRAIVLRVGKYVPEDQA